MLRRFSTYYSLLTTYSSRAKAREGFTIFELIIFSAILTLMVVSFLAILVSITKVHVRQSAAAEVNQQSQFLLQTIQYYVEQSSVVDMAENTVTSTLKLRMAASSSDPLYIYLSGGGVYLRQMEGGVAQPLTSGRVSVSNLQFTKRAHPNAHDSVTIALTVGYNTQSVGESFSQTLDTAIARVSAASFDSNLIPSTTATYDVGVASQIWRSVNNILYFSGSNVGIGVVSPGQTLEVNGGLRVNTTATKPTCDSSQRGTFWVTQSGAGVQDSVQVCAKSAADAYAWRTIY